MFPSYRIGPFEVESALIEHPSIAESAVVSSPDPVRGEVREPIDQLNTYFTCVILCVLSIQHICGCDFPVQRHMQISRYLPQSVLHPRLLRRGVSLKLGLTVQARLVGGLVRPCLLPVCCPQCWGGRAALLWGWGGRPAPPCMSPTREWQTCTATGPGVADPRSSALLTEPSPQLLNTDF